MLYFLCGDDSYLIREKVAEIRNALEQSVALDFVKLDGESLTKNGFVSAVLSGSLFANRKLVVVYNLLLAGKIPDFKDTLLGIMPKISTETTVIFVEDGKPDARTALFKFLNDKKNSTVFELNHLAPNQCLSWIQKKVEEAGGSISARDANLVYVSVGSDLARLANEIEKLVLYAQTAGDGTIASDHIAIMVKSANSATIFEFIEAVAGRNAKKAIHYLYQLKESGENDHYILSMIVYQYRQMLILADLAQRGAALGVLAKESGIHPYVVGKLTKLLPHYPLNVLRKIYRELEQADIDLKTSMVNEELIIDRLVVKLANNLIE